MFADCDEMKIVGIYDDIGESSKLIDRCPIFKKKIFSTDNSLLKSLYYSTEKVAKKWIRKYPNWDLVINQLKILLMKY